MEAQAAGRVAPGIERDDEHGRRDPLDALPGREHVRHDQRTDGLAVRKGEGEDDAASAEGLQRDLSSGLIGQRERGRDVVHAGQLR